MKRFRIFNYLVIGAILLSGFTKLSAAKKNAGELISGQFIHQSPAVLALIFEFNLTALRVPTT
jgi:hypothetical protein